MLPAIKSIKYSVEVRAQLGRVAACTATTIMLLGSQLILQDYRLSI